MNQQKIYSIKEVTNYIKSVMDQDPLLTQIWIRGEISNFTHHSSGHMYFTLKDEASRLRSIMFAGNNRFIKFIPNNGMKVIAKGYISIYERDGQYQFYAQEMEPDGVGALYIAYEQLKKKLEEEGLFDPHIKKKLPSFPQSIGLITSGTGAAIRDMITTINRRYPYVHLLIYPVLVQGESAPKSIADAIDQMNEFGQADLLIVGRGGGSIEELWAFNEEIVARSIYASSIPIISAVGHETDFTIADFVADIRAATPTAAAELAVPHIDEVKTSITYLTKQLEKNMIRQTEQARGNLFRLLQSIVFRRPKQLVMEQVQRVDRLEDRLQFNLNKHMAFHKEKFYEVYHQLIQEKPQLKVQTHKEKLYHLNKQLQREMQTLKEGYRKDLSLKVGKLDALSPLKVLKRGYAIPFNEREKDIVKSINQVQLGDIIKLQLQDGKLDCQVWGMEEKINESK